MIPPAPPRIAIFLPHLGVGGAERVMLRLAEGFLQRGLPVDLVLCRRSGDLLAEVPPGLQVVELGASSEYTCLPALTRWLRNNPPAALLTTLPLSSCAAVLARRISGARTRLVIRQASTTSLFTRSWLKKKIERPLLRWLYPRADALVAVSRGVADDLAAYLGLPVSSMQVIYNPVLRPGLAALADAPLEHPFFGPGQPPVILAAGRLIALKDFPTLLAAFAGLRRERPCRLVILGEGPERPRLEALAARLGVQDDVSLPGYSSNVYAFMSRSAAFVLSSRSEGLPNALIEALACGLPAVSTDCPSGPAEVLDGGRYGGLVPVGDVPAMQAALASALDGQLASPPEEYMQRFALDTVVEQYLSLLGPVTSPVEEAVYAG